MRRNLIYKIPYIEAPKNQYTIEFPAANKQEAKPVAPVNVEPQVEKKPVVQKTEETPVEKKKEPVPEPKPEIKKVEEEKKIAEAPQKIEVPSEREENKPKKIVIRRQILMKLIEVEL